MSDPDLSDINRRMHGAIEALKHEYGGLRTGRASPALLEPIVVDCYGAQMPLNHGHNWSALGMCVSPPTPPNSSSPSTARVAGTANGGLSGSDRAHSGEAYDDLIVTASYVDLRDEGTMSAGLLRAHTGADGTGEAEADDTHPDPDAGRGVVGASPASSLASSHPVTPLPHAPSHFSSCSLA